MKSTIFRISALFLSCAHFSTPNIVESKSFILHHLPDRLRQDFDEAENKRTLSHLLTRRSTVVISPSWTVSVSWKCHRCGHRWLARPCDRASLQSSGAYDCRMCSRSSSPNDGGTLSAEFDGDQKDSAFSRKACSFVPSNCREGDAVHMPVKRLPVGGPFCHLKRTLASCSYLLSEAKLRPHQDACEVSLYSDTLLNWRCSCCHYDFKASIKNRYLHNERCPQCSGKVKSAFNSLVTQRSDIVEEVSSVVSNTALCSITVHDQVELPFVCRKCYYPYRMRISTRAKIPKGVCACPRCLLALSQLGTISTENLKFKYSVNTSKNPSKQVMYINNERNLLSRDLRSADGIKLTKHLLQHPDLSLKN